MQQNSGMVLIDAAQLQALIQSAVEAAVGRIVEGTIQKQDQYLNAKEAAKALGISQKTFYTRVQTGKIKAVFLPGASRPVYSKNQIMGGSI